MPERQERHGDRTATADFAAYMKVVDHNIAREAVCRHKEFKSEIYDYCGQVHIIEARKYCVRFVCSTETQRDMLHDRIGHRQKRQRYQTVLGYETTGSASD